MWQQGAGDFGSAHNTARWIHLPKLRPHQDSVWPRTGHHLTVHANKKRGCFFVLVKGACLKLSVGGIVVQALLLYTSFDNILRTCKWPSL